MDRARPSHAERRAPVWLAGARAVELVLPASTTKSGCTRRCTTGPRRRSTGRGRLPGRGSVNAQRRTRPPRLALTYFGLPAVLAMGTTTTMLAPRSLNASKYSFSCIQQPPRPVGSRAGAPTAAAILDAAACRGCAITAAIGSRLAYCTVPPLSVWGPAQLASARGALHELEGGEAIGVAGVERARWHTAGAASRLR